MKKVFAISLATCLCTACFSQNIGIGTLTPHTSAALDISSTARGLLIPRMTSTGIATITNPAKGLMVYDSIKNQLVVNIGTASIPNWQNIVANSGWGLNGNTGTNSAAQFIGTGDSASFVVKAFNKLSGYIDVSGNANTSFGYKSLLNNTTGFYNTAIGSNVLVNNSTGVRNTSVGSYSLNANTTGSFNTAMGLYALGSNVEGYNNIAAGVNSLANNTYGNDNTGYGTNSLYSNISGNSNVGIGKDALFSNTQGHDNTAQGYQALYDNTMGFQNTAVGNGALKSNTTGFYNTAAGYNALRSNTKGAYNVANGFFSLANTAISDYNTAFGTDAGSTFDNGSYNVFLGAFADVNNAGYSFNIAIGYMANCTSSGQVTIGSSSNTSYRAYANWGNISDGRFKKNIQENVPGLDFINQLRPVTYNLKATELDAFVHKNSKQATQPNDKRTGALSSNKQAAGQANDAAAKADYTQALKEKEALVCTGFVAQEVEATAKKIGFNFSGVDAPKNENDVYALRYAEFVVPLVKAVQELNSNNKAQQQQIEILKLEKQNQQAINTALQKQIDELKVLLKK